jgi:hypothetical protein
VFLKVPQISFERGIPYAALLMVRYFSFKVVFDGLFLPSGRPSILVAPPHGNPHPYSNPSSYSSPSAIITSTAPHNSCPVGVFPYGNLLTMLAFPSLFGFPFTGVAASAALTTPIFRQILESIGVEEASAKNCTKVLSEGRTLGVSTGGVAEVFQTQVVDSWPADPDSAGEECLTSPRYLVPYSLWCVALCCVVLS